MGRTHNVYTVTREEKIREEKSIEPLPLELGIQRIPDNLLTGAAGIWRFMQAREWGGLPMVFELAGDGGDRRRAPGPARAAGGLPRGPSTDTPRARPATGARRA